MGLYTYLLGRELGIGSQNRKRIRSTFQLGSSDGLAIVVVGYLHCEARCLNRTATPTVCLLSQYQWLPLLTMQKLGQ